MNTPVSLCSNIYLLCCRVKNWALKFGVDLWEFGRQFTKMSEIQKVSSSVLQQHRSTVVLIQCTVTRSSNAVMLNPQCIMLDSHFSCTVTETARNLLSDWSEC